VDREGPEEVTPYQFQYLFAEYNWIGFVVALLVVIGIWKLVRGRK
jgi:hypothetical protein